MINLIKAHALFQETNQLTGQKFTIKYHDMEDVVDFLVLRHIYESSMAVTWSPGDRYRYVNHAFKQQRSIIFLLLINRVGKGIFRGIKVELELNLYKSFPSQ